MPRGLEATTLTCHPGDRGSIPRLGDEKSFSGFSYHTYDRRCEMEHRCEMISPLRSISLLWIIGVQGY